MVQKQYTKLLIVVLISSLIAEQVAQFLPVESCLSFKNIISTAQCQNKSKVSHCVQNDDNKDGLVCTDWKWIPEGKCPYYDTFAMRLNDKDCQSSSGTCAENKYNSTQSQNYSGCYPKTEPIPLTTIAGRADERTEECKQTTGNDLLVPLILTGIFAGICIIVIIILCCKYKIPSHGNGGLNCVPCEKGKHDPESNLDGASDPLMPVVSDTENVPVASDTENVPVASDTENVPVASDTENAQVASDTKNGELMAPKEKPMKTLKEIFDGMSSTTNSMSYTSAVKAVICGVGNIIKYRNASGEQRQSLTIGFADSSMAVKGVLYDTSRVKSIKVGTTVMFLNSIFKKDTTKSIALTSRTKILQTGPIKISDSLRKEGFDIACPPPADLIDIKAVHTYPVKTLVTIRGEVVSEEMERTVKVKGEDTHVRSLKLKDNTGLCKISLWRDLAKSKTTVGSYIEVTNAVVEIYNDEKSLSTTVRSKLERIAAPEIIKDVTFISFEFIDENYASLTSDDEYEEFTVKKEIIANAIYCTAEEVESSLIEKLPINCKITVKENEISEMQITF